MDVVQRVGCVIMDEYERILLLHRNTAEFQHWDLPGGKVDEGETSAQAAMRELYEELGVHVRLIKLLGSDQFEDALGLFNFHCFQAVIVSGQPAVQELETFDDCDYIDFEDLLGLSLSANMQVLYPKLLSGEIRLE
ncbi:MAG TPA: NUDIX hydrolase [Candidatus Saccharimonadales bacterium]|nr:NUDIX hydrolase [Candidatus Saccharimonadales bacterium]